MPTLPPIDERDRAIQGIPTQPEKAKTPPLPTHDLTELDDGSVEVSFPEEEQKSNGEFLSNLAETLPQDELHALAQDYLEHLERDRQARKRRDEQYEEGLRRTGLGDDAPGGAEFAGASRAVHPVLAKSCVDFASRAIKELFPPSGPVKSSIDGQENEPKIDLANRKVKFLNWQLRRQIMEYKDELEQLLTQLPMGGSQYQKFWYDDGMRRIRTEFVPIDDILLPYSATNFYSSPRVTHVQHITAMELKKRTNSGLYVEIGDISVPVGFEEKSSAAQANEKIEGKEEDAYNEDGLRDVFEIYTWLELEGDDITQGALAPYIVTIDHYTEQVLAIYRNWEEGDDLYIKLDWLVDWKFFPWRGAYAIGMLHMIGSLAGAATGSLRALLDSALLNNSATLVKLKGSKMSGQNTEIDPTQVAEIEGPAGIDDIRKVMMPMPYNQPSTVLFQLLGWLTQAAEGVIATAEEKLDQVGDRTPVGTTQALIEQGSHTYSAIHSRLHASQAKALEIICRLNRVYLDEHTEVKDLGGLVMSRKDFEDSQDICPVSDPEIFSEAQRYAQNQGIMQVRQLYNGQVLPNLPFNDIQIVRRILRRMKIDNIDDILPEPAKPKNMNPVAENVAALKGQQLAALPPQNHLAHIHAHVEFATNPLIANPLMGQRCMGVLLQHVAEHIGLMYAELTDKLSQYQMHVGKLPTRALENKLAAANQQVMQQMQQMLAPIMPGLQQMQQMAQQWGPKPPVDPAVDATFKAAMAEVDRKKQRDKAELTLEQQLKTQVHPALEQSKHQVDLAKNDADNQQKQITDLLKNQGDNETKQWIAALQAQQQNLMDQFQAKLNHVESIANMLMSGKQQAQQQMVNQQNDNQQAAMDRAHELVMSNMNNQHQANINDANNQNQQEINAANLENQQEMAAQKPAPSGNS